MICGHRAGQGVAAADPAALTEVIKTLLDNGGRVLDTVDGADAAEEVSGRIANELGIQRKIFWSTSLFVGCCPPRPPEAPSAEPNADPAAVRARVERALATLHVATLNLAMVMAHADIPTHLTVLREMKKEGRVRYIGVAASSSLRPFRGLWAPSASRSCATAEKTKYPHRE